MRKWTPFTAPRAGPTSKSSRPTARLRRSATDVLMRFGMAPDPALVQLLSADLDALAAPDGRIGVAVSGGPDSLALLLLAAAARPGNVEAATIDHGLRAEAREEAVMVAAVCDRLAVRHATLTARWSEVPETAIQERARNQRYRLLG